MCDTKKDYILLRDMMSETGRQNMTMVGVHTTKTKCGWYIRCMNGSDRYNLLSPLFINSVLQMYSQFVILLLSFASVAAPSSSSTGALASPISSSFLHIKHASCKTQAELMTVTIMWCFSVSKYRRPPELALKCMQTRRSLHYNSRFCVLFVIFCVLWRQAAVLFAWVHQVLAEGYAMSLTIWLPNRNVPTAMLTAEVWVTVGPVIVERPSFPSCIAKGTHSVVTAGL